MFSFHIPHSSPIRDVSSGVVAWRDQQPITRRSDRRMQRAQQQPRNSPVTKKPPEIHVNR
jgi:hypothetical protein